MTPPAQNNQNVNLTFTATDDTGVTGINLYRDGQEIAALTGNPTTWTDNNVTPGRKCYSATAKDAAGNTSDETTPTCIDVQDNTPKPTPTFNLTTAITSQAFSQQNYLGTATNQAKIVFVDSGATGTLEEKLNNSAYKASCGTIDKDQTISCTITGIPETVSGNLYALTDFMGNPDLAETGDAVSAGYAADKNTTVTIDLTVDKRLATPGTTTYGGHFYCNKSNLLGGSWG